MTWARFDDVFPSHRKVRRTTDAAFRLHVSGICWSAKYLTDGHISAEDLEMVGDDLDDSADPAVLKNAVECLLQGGVWHVAKHDCPTCPTSEDGGWIIHDYLDKNPSSEQVRHQRRQAADRQRRARERGTEATRHDDEQSRQDGKTSRRDSRVSHGVSHASVTATRPVPLEVQVLKSKPRESSKEDPLPPTRKKRAPVGVKTFPTADEAFDRFWATYPRRTAKPAAIKAWTKAVAKVDVEALITGAARYRDDPTRSPAFTAHPSTWLNNERWDDQPAEPGSRVSPDNGHRPYTDPTDMSIYEGPIKA